MKIKESTSIALKISLLLSLLTAIFFIILSLNISNSIYILIGVLACVFFISFWLLRMYIEQYIYNRIKLIYKIINNTKEANKEEKSKQILRHSIAEVHQEAIEWQHDYEKQLHKLKELEQYRKEYIGDISHELKTPLFSLLGYTSTLLDGGIHDDNINIKYLERSEKNINRLIEIVKELESISQLESGQIELKPERFDIKQLCEEVIESLEIEAQKKNVKIFFGKRYDQSIFVEADKKQIHRLLSNLIKNAIKYGYKDTGTVKISFFDMDKQILTEITDNGPGIATEDLPRIFNRFYRTDKARSREQGGTGLGLAIVKHIAEVHKQRVFVRASLGIGSTFGFTLKKLNSI